jgi:HlyD family secretion protein
MKKWIIVLVVVVVIAAAAAYFFGPFRGQSQAASGDLQTVPAEMGDLTATIGATGVVRADQTAILPWQTSGTVENVNILVGEAVTKGQVLAFLEQTSLPQNVILAQADLVSAHKSLDDLLNSQLLRLRHWRQSPKPRKHSRMLSGLSAGQNLPLARALLTKLRLRLP